MKEQLEQAFDWAGIDYLVQQTPCGQQTQVTIHTDDIARLVDLIIAGAKHNNRER